MHFCREVDSGCDVSTFDEGVCKGCYTFAGLTGFCYVCTLKELDRYAEWDDDA